jgi:hypothetical protein
MDRRFLTSFFGGDSLSKNLLALLALVNVLELSLLEMEQARCRGESHLIEDASVMLAAVTKDLSFDCCRLSFGVSGKGLSRCSLAADFCDTTLNRRSTSSVL